MSNSKPDMIKNGRSDNKASSSYKIEDHKDCLLIQQTIRNVMIICLDESWEGSEAELDQQLEIFFKIQISKISYTECLSLFLIGKIEAIEYLIKRKKWNEKRLPKIKQVKQELKNNVIRKLKDCLVGQMEFKNESTMSFQSLKKDESIQQIQY